MKKVRLDKFIADRLCLSRKEARLLVFKGNISLNNKTTTYCDIQICESDIIKHNESEIKYGNEFLYYVINKPKDMITAKYDKKHRTVMELLPKICIKNDVVPVGRLDIDTTGLLLFTNDGKLNHALLSPKRDIQKTYIALIDKLIDETDMEIFKNGVVLSDFIAKPAILEKSNISDYHVIVKISEGKFHQVKRMFSAINANVIELKRTTFASLKLDLLEGDYRELTDIEIKSLYDLAEIH